MKFVIDFILREFGWPTLVLMVVVVALASVALVHGLATGRASNRLGILLGCVVFGGWLLTVVLAALGIH